MGYSPDTLQRVSAYTYICVQYKDCSKKNRKYWVLQANNEMNSWVRIDRQRMASLLQCKISAPLQ